MDDERMKRLFYFSLAVLLAIFLIWFGSKFLFFTGDLLSSTQLFVYGCIVLFGGICLMTVPDLNKNWWVGVPLLVIGFYFFGRASGTIEMPWLARILGAGSLVAAFLLVYITWPGRIRKTDTSRDADENYGR